MIDLERLKENLVRVRVTMASAAARSGRPVEAARLVAVTKTVGSEEIAALAGLGQRDFGESRVEQLILRAAEADAAGLGARWHMIGHLQRRKVRDLLPSGALIHGLDSWRLAEEIEKRAAEIFNPSPLGDGGPGAPGPGEGLRPETVSLSKIAILLEVNISGEEQKYGLWPDEIAEVVEQLAGLAQVDLRGLMTMAPLAAEAELSRPVFCALRELRDRINAAGVYPRPLVELSMGMSQDYAVAVEEGATLVRVGTALFE
jgi:hypothetical protein